MLDRATCRARAGPHSRAWPMLPSPSEQGGPQLRAENAKMRPDDAQCIPGHMSDSFNVARAVGCASRFCACPVIHSMGLSLLRGGACCLCVQLSFVAQLPDCRFFEGRLRQATTPNTVVEDAERTSAAQPALATSRKGHACIEDWTELLILLQAMDACFQAGCFGGSPQGAGM